MIHLSKELHIKLDKSKPFGYKFVLKPGDGKTYRRNPPKAPSKRDLHREAARARRQS